MAPNLDQDARSVAALAEPVRRRLYQEVSRADEPLSREQAAEAAGVAVHTAKFHLDKLVDEGLLEADFKRMSGRTGPGAGRPAKVYRRAAREFAVSLPPRQYDLVGRILANAVAASMASGESVAHIAADLARREGVKSADETPRSSSPQPLARLAAVLANDGFEPKVDTNTMVLQNCPFHRLAAEQTELVCGLNLEYVQGVCDGLGCSSVEPRLKPREGYCCVEVVE